MERPEDTLTPTESAAFAALPRAIAVDPAEEDRTVLALRAVGLLRGSPVWRWPLAVAAALVLFLAGFGVGRSFGRAPTTRDTGASVLGTIAGATTAAEREEVRNILLAGLALLDREAPQRSARVVWF